MFRPGGYFTDSGYISILAHGRKQYFLAYDEYMNYLGKDDAA